MIRPALAGRLARVAVVTLVTLGVAACGDATTPTDGSGAGPTDATPTARPTHDPGATVDVGGLLSGDWRRLPFDPRTSSDIPRLDATCRAAEPAIAGLPVALTDARGRGRLQFVYATDPTSAAWECRIGLDAATAADAEVVALQAGGEPIADDEIDARHYETLPLGAETGTVLVGRIGRLADEAIGQFDADETYIYAAIGGGWWSMWWPGTDVVNGVGATDTHNVVIGEVKPVLPLVPAVP